MNKEDLKAIRKAKNMNQQDFADWLGYTKDHVSRMERGASLIPRAVELACKDEIEVKFDLEMMEEVHKYSNKHNKTFKEGFFELVSKGLGTSLVLSLGFLSYKHPQKALQISENVIEAIYNLAA